MEKTITTTGAAIDLYRALLTAEQVAPEDDCEDPALHYVHIKHGRTTLKIRNTHARLAQFAADVLKTWKLWGGGEKPASDKPAKLKSQWKAGTVKLVAELLEDGDYAAALDMAERECGGIVCQSETGEQFLFYAREQVEGMPEGVEVGKTCAGNWVVAHGKTGRVILNTRGKVKTKASALAMFARTRALWSDEDFAEGLARLTACDFESARATWMMQNGIAPAPESLPPVADAAPVEALPVPEVAPVAIAVEPAPVPTAPELSTAVQRYALLSDSETLQRLAAAGFSAEERTKKNPAGVRTFRLSVTNESVTFFTSITLPTTCDVVAGLEEKAKKLMAGNLSMGANLMSHIAQPDPATIAPALAPAPEFSEKIAEEISSPTTAEVQPEVVAEVAQATTEDKPELAPRHVSSSWVCAAGNWETLGEDGAKNHPGFASEKSARIAIAKNPEWKKRNATILPFHYNDGSYGMKYSDTRTRYVIVARKIAPAAPATTVVDVAPVQPEESPASAPAEEVGGVEGAARSNLESEPVAYQWPDVLALTVEDVQAMPADIYAQHLDKLEDINHHTEALMLECLRAGRGDLAKALAHLVRIQRAHDYMGIGADVAEARAVIGRLLHGCPAGDVSPEARATLERWGLSLPRGGGPDAEALTPPVVQKAEELTPRVAASPGFINLMAQARAARQLAREAIARAKASSAQAVCISSTPKATQPTQAQPAPAVRFMAHYVTDGKNKAKVRYYASNDRSGRAFVDVNAKHYGAQLGRMLPEGVPPGEYRPTEVDAKKKAADFLLTGVSSSKMEIRWKCGRCERVTERKLAKLQALHTWTTDF